MKAFLDLILKLFKAYSAQQASTMPSYFSRDEYLKGRDVEYPLTPELEENMSILLERISLVREQYGKPMNVSSGYRPGHHNIKAGGSARSAHITCEAIDILDIDRKFSKWIVDNKYLLQELDLYVEDPNYTNSWVHLQTRPTRSGNRIFIP